MTEQEAISVLKMIETHGSLPTNAKDEAIKALEEVQQYRAIGTPEECLAAVEKQNAKKPNYDDYHRAGYRCQTCNNVNPWGYKHCKHCGQKLDWEGGGVDE